MPSALLSDVPSPSACLRAYMQIASDCSRRTPNIRAMFSGVRTEEARPGGFLHVTETSLCHCLTHRRITFGDGASCLCSSRRNPRWVSVMYPVRINSTTAHTLSQTPKRYMSTKFEGHCFSSNACTQWYPSGEARNYNFKMLHYFCRTRCNRGWHLKSYINLLLIKFGLLAVLMADSLAK
jgi:hypothetical protein